MLKIGNLSLSIKNYEFMTENYRPISLLRVSHKLLEKLMYKRLKSFLERQDISYQYRYGFRTNHSTTHALVDVLNFIIFFCHHLHMEWFPFSDLRIFSLPILLFEWLTSTPFLLLVYYLFFCWIFAVALVWCLGIKFHK